MSITLSDISLGTYVQLVSSASNIIDKAEKTINTEEIINMKLYDDMKPFTFQVFSIVHHSVGAIGALKTGEFGPPMMPDNLTFLELKNMLKDADKELKGMDPTEINDLSEQKVVFKMGPVEWPFTATDFILSFSLPNFYFHLTTFYDMLRMKGIEIGKLDFIGEMKLNN